MEKYGFVYIWRDRKHNRYYIGCHWGTEDDGYICSSRWMRNAYKRRPDDFRRRILSRVDSARSDLLAEEYKWLQLIPENQLGNKYYNLTSHLNNHWTSDEDKTSSIKQKLSEAQKRNFQDPEYRARFMETRKKLPPQTEETREKRRQSMLGKNTGRPKTQAFYDAAEKRRGSNISEEHKQKIREAGVFAGLNKKRVQCAHCGTWGNPGNIGRYHNDKCRHKPA